MKFEVHISDIPWQDGRQGGSVFSLHAEKPPAVNDLFDLSVAELAPAATFQVVDVVEDRIIARWLPRWQLLSLVRLLDAEGRVLQEQLASSIQDKSIGWTRR